MILVPVVTATMADLPPHLADVRNKVTLGVEVVENVSADPAPALLCRPGLLLACPRAVEPSCLPTSPNRDSSSHTALHPPASTRSSGLGSVRDGGQCSAPHPPGKEAGRVPDRRGER